MGFLNGWVINRRDHWAMQHGDFVATEKPVTLISFGTMDSR